MKLALLLALAVAILLGAGLFLLRGAPPAPPPGPGPGEVYLFPIPGPEAPAKAPAPPKPPKDPSVQPRLPAPDSVPRRPLGAMPAGGAGQMRRPDLAAADREKADALELKLIEARIGEVDWKSQPLRKVVDLLAEKTGIPFEIEGEGLDDEPISKKDPGDNVLALLQHVTMERHLRFEITPEKVILRR